MRIQHRMICQQSFRISAVKVRGVREEKGRRDEKEDRKNAKVGNKSNIKLRSSNKNSTSLVNTSCLTEKIDQDTTQNGMSTIFQDLCNKSRLAEHWTRNLICP